MTTLGLLSVGLLVLVLIVAAGIALLARSQRRAPRGPEQPRTVADLVRMREAAAEERAAATAAETDASTDVAVRADSDEAATLVQPTPAPASPTSAPSAEAEDLGQVPSAGAPSESEATTELVAPAAEGEESPLKSELPQSAAEADGPEAQAAEAAQPESDPASTGSVQDTPWARAARMADPLGEWTASARAARERTGTPDPHPVPRDVPKARTPEKEPAVPPPPRLSLLDPDRAALEHDTTTVAHLPKGFAQSSPPPTDAAASSVGPEAVAERAAAEQTAASQLDDDTVQLGWPPAAGAAPQAPAGPDDSVTVNFAHPSGGRPAESATSAAAVEPPEEHTGPVDTTAFAAFGTALATSTVADPSARSGALRLLTPVDVVEAAVPVGVAAVAPLHTPARVAGRIRRSPADTAAEQAAADLALLRTFGVAGPGHTSAADDTEVELEGCSPEDAEPSAGAAQPVAFRVVDRDGRGLAGASVTLLDDHGREIAGTAADERGAGKLTARRPGGYMLVTAADGYQPGAVTIAVVDAPVDTEIPLTRSASIAGSVCGEDGPVVGAHLILVQDGEIIDTTDSGVDGAYVFADLAAGEYGLSVTAAECEPTALVVRLADEADLRHDVDLDPVGLPACGATDDVMIGHL